MPPTEAVPLNAVEDASPSAFDEQEEEAQGALPGGLQKKLTVGAPDDPLEQEADRAAANITGGKPQGGTESDSQGHPTGSGGGTGSLTSRITSPSSGRPLSDSFRGDMETSFGTDFSAVRVHDSAQDRADAQSLDAQAFTHKQDIWLGRSASADDRTLMAHELTHVVQQGADIRRSNSGKNLSTTAVGNESSASMISNLHVKPSLPAIDQPARGVAEAVAVQRLGTSLHQPWSPSEPVPTHGDKSGRQRRHSPTQKAILRSSEPQPQNPNEPVLEPYRGPSVNKLGQISAPAGQYEIAKAGGVNVRARPDGTLPHIAKVVYGTEVQVQALDNTEAFYFVTATAGVVGWVNRDFVALGPPDLGARLHHITESNLTTILKNEYIDKNLWRLGTGNDYTTLAAAVVAANAGRKGVFVDWGAAEKYKEDHRMKRWFDPWMIDNFAIYHGSTLLAGHNIWLPSPTYVRMLQASGVIGSRPGWVNAAVDVGKGLAGFLAGVVSGVFGSIWDTLTGLWELAEGIVSAVRSILDGSLFASIEDIYNTITNMTMEDLKRLIEGIITMGRNALGDFQRKWEHPDTYQQWYFKGYIVGAIALEVVLAILSGGASLAVKVLAKIGKYFPKLMRVLTSLLELAKKLPGRRNKVPGDGDRDRRNQDRDRDDEDMSNADRAWEQARVLATIVTEEHDRRDTPVAILIPHLNTTIAQKFKGVSSYQAIPLSQPNTYKVIQRAKRRRDVDDHYTEKERTVVSRWVPGPHDEDWRGLGRSTKEALDHAFTRTGVARSEFSITQWGNTRHGKSFPAEYRVLTGPNRGAEVNIDVGHKKAGPEVPHVGWQTPGKRDTGGAARGHILLDDVEYNR